MVDGTGGWRVEAKVEWDGGSTVLTGGVETLP